jgi:hypothetical protein
VLLLLLLPLLLKLHAAGADWVDEIGLEIRRGNSALNGRLRSLLAACQTAAAPPAATSCR